MINSFCQLSRLPAKVLSGTRRFLYAFSQSDDPARSQTTTAYDECPHQPDALPVVLPVKIFPFHSDTMHQHSTYCKSKIMLDRQQRDQSAASTRRHYRNCQKFSSLTSMLLFPFRLSETRIHSFVKQSNASETLTHQFQGVSLKHRINSIIPRYM